MSVGLLIITHEGIGRYLLDTAIGMLIKAPMDYRLLDACEHDHPDELIQKAVKLVQDLDQGDGVLVLTDMYGSTPSNVARAISGKHVQCVAGVNLPMIIRVFNYYQLPLSEIAQKAYSGGRDGVKICVSDSSP